MFFRGEPTLQIKRLHVPLWLEEGPQLSVRKTFSEPSEITAKYIVVKLSTRLSFLTPEKLTFWWCPHNNSKVLCLHRCWSEMSNHVGPKCERCSFLSEDQTPLASEAILNPRA